MPPLDNPKHELFAQGLAKGKTADEAYQDAGYAANRGNAATLKANQSIAGRVAELLSGAAERAEISVAGITKRLIKIADAAELLADAPGMSVARASLMDAAKLNGLIVDKTQNENTNRDAVISNEPESEAEWSQKTSALH